MKEIIYNFNEFKEKMSKNAPLHHSYAGRFLDKEGMVYELTFRIFGVSRSGRHIIIFEAKKRTNMLSKEFNERWFTGNFHDQLRAAVKNALYELKKNYAALIGSTKGRLEF